MERAEGLGDIGLSSLQSSSVCSWHQDYVAQRLAVGITFLGLRDRPIRLKQNASILCDKPVIRAALSFLTDKYLIDLFSTSYQAVNSLST